MLEKLNPGSDESKALRAALNAYEVAHGTAAADSAAH